MRFLDFNEKLVPQPNDVLLLQDNVDGAVKHSKIGSLPSSGGGGVWKKIHQVDLPNRNDYTIFGLDGNTEKFYKIIYEGQLTFGSGTFIKIRPNGDASNIYRSSIIFSQSNSPNNYIGLVTGLQIGSSANGQGGTIIGESLFCAKAGKRRVVTGNYCYATADSNFVQTNNFAGFWNNQVDNIEFLTINFDDFGSFVGSFTLLTLV